MSIATPERKNHRGFILAKNPSYFQETYAWRGILNSVTKATPAITDNITGESIPFTLLAMAGSVGESGEDSSIPPDEPHDRIKNIGTQDQQTWRENVAASKFMLGIGRPFLSPSPWESLCYGVPYINVILNWDKNSPWDKSRWWTQQDQLRRLGPPLVYHVHANNEAELQYAMANAAANPIERYIDPQMTLQAVAERQEALLSTELRSEAQKYIEQNPLSGESLILL
ncbi:MAG: hypothetical protein TREMPRED_001214 [Tremellales sp. Tagirdzhanova-0007]|nr:MAG: hypothetical protein TREMPRED_001214 [Tremellales sp. Tagirdzhanova-0007]